MSLLSDFLYATKGEFAPGMTMADTHAALKAMFTGSGWQVINEQTATAPYWFDLYPPSSELIGDATSAEYLRVRISPNYLDFIPRRRWFLAVPATILLRANAKEVLATNKSADITLNGTTVTASAVAGESMTTLWRRLLNELMNGTGDFARYRWSLGEDAYYLAITGVCQDTNAQAGTLSVSGAGVASGTLKQNRAADQDCPAQYGDSTHPLPINGLSIDIAGGWAYYFRLGRRSVGMVTKTSGGVYGSKDAAWVDHAAAVAFSQSVIGSPTPIPPCELVVVEGTVYPGSVVFLPPLPENLSPTSGRGSFGGAGVMTIEPSLAQCAYPSDQYQFVTFQALAATQLSRYTNQGVLAQVVVAEGNLTDNCFGGSTTYGRGEFPPVPVPGAFTFAGNSPTYSAETLMVAGLDEGASWTLAAMDATSDYASLGVNSTALFAESGEAVTASGEVIGYTGKTANSLTGVTRGLYGTGKRPLETGGRICPAGWFLRGTTRPLFLGPQKV